MTIQPGAPIQERRQISEQEKSAVLARQGLRCFVDGHLVDSEAELHFDHIRAFSEGGPSSVENVAAVCAKHNRERGSLSLAEYRDRLALRRFFEGARKRRLDDLLEERLNRSGYGQSLTAELDSGEIVLFLDAGPVRVPLAQCPATGERYFFAMLPVANIRNDTELQPRALEPDRLWELYRHLLTHTQLAPAVCRLVDGSVLLFDGRTRRRPRSGPDVTGSTARSTLIPRSAD